MTDYEINEEIDEITDNDDSDTGEDIEPIEPPVIHTYALKIEGANDEFVLENLGMNGTNYVSDSYVDTSEWPPIFSLTATDEDGNVTESIAHAKLIQQETYTWDEGKYYLAFAAVSQQEIINAEKELKITDLEETAADLLEENLAQDDSITALEEMVAELYEGSAE